MLSRKLKSRTKRRRTKRNKRQINNRIDNTIRYIERFGLISNSNDDYSKNVKNCNKILLENEKKCNIFNKNGYPIGDAKHTKNNDSNCFEYNKCKSEFATYMSGYEPSYNPDKWSDPIVEGSHNCYTYFLNDQIPEVKNKCRKLCKKKNKCKRKISECGNLKPQPGNHASRIGLTEGKNRVYNCKEMVRKVIVDNTDKISGRKYIYPVDFNKKCPPHYYKGAVVVDPKKTYHFYRQDNNVRFSHKQGTLRVENVDASNKPIYAPHLSDMNYNKDNRKGGINYTDFCSYLCVPNNNYIDTHAI